jgi:phage-related protein
MEWNTIEYEKENGEKPVSEWLDSLPPKGSSKVLEDIEKLEQFGLRWGMPHVRHMGDGIWELRTKQGNNIYRVFMFRWYDTILVLTHGLTKKSEQTPKGEIKRAIRYRDDWLKRKGEK